MENVDGRGEKRGRGVVGVKEEQSAEDGDNKRPRKVPALASVIVEALKLDSLQRLCSSLEPLLRRIVSEEVERALTKLGHTNLTTRSSTHITAPPEGRNLQLHFKSRLPPHLFTGGKVEGVHGAAVHVVLLDANTGLVTSSGPESMVKLDVVVLEGDFNEEEDSDWTAERFESYEVKERQGKKPLLTGDLQVMLKEGIGTLGELMFTDNSSWIRSRKFRLGLKVSAGPCENIRIREAKTEAFTVKDHRGELYKKHYPPTLHDEVWRLDRIAKDGSLHKKLINAKISTVEDFLRLLVRDPQKLRNILGTGMSNRMWDNTVEHAKTCVLDGKLYVYYSDETRVTGVVFNDIYELRGLITNGQFLSIEALSHYQKASVDTLMKKAYENWNRVVEYDGQLLLSSVSATMNTHSLPATAVDHSTSIGQYFMPTSYSENYLESDARTHLQTGTAQYTSSQLALPNSQAADVEDYISEDRSHSRDGQDFEDVFSEEEIRMRGLEILEHDDMQNLLRSLGMGNVSGAFENTAGDCFPYGEIPLSQATSSFRHEHRRRNTKAVVGWLKLKAAFRWSIFIRKQAAKRRACLVELD